MALIMETTKGIVAKEPIKGSIEPDEFDRQPFQHPQLQSLDNLNMEGPKDIAGKEQLYKLAADVGLIDVVRWKPRLVRRPYFYTTLTSLESTANVGNRSGG